MKLFMLLFVLAALAQTAFLPLNLCLILLICRSFGVKENSNFMLAFLAGIVLGLLSAQNLGFWPLIFLIVVELTYLFKKLPLSSNLLMILPLSLALIFLTSLLEKTFLNQTTDFKIILLETILTFPVYILIKFWENRFIIKNEIKLKVN